MKFEEKLIILRKQNLLSQEGLAEKLDVTRQTVSKWELGQSRPDMDKLTLMSKLFDVSIDTLTNDEVFLDDKKEEVRKEKSNKKTNGGGNRKFLLYIFILIFIASLTTLTYRVAYSIKEKKDAIKEEARKSKEEALKKQKEIEDKIQKANDEFEEESKKHKEEMNKNSFNSSFETYDGTQVGTGVSHEIDEVMQNNKKNSDKLIEVVFDGTSYGTDAENIKNIKNSLKDFNGYNLQYYEVSLDYDDNGYVNKVTIETK